MSRLHSRGEYLMVGSMYNIYKREDKNDWNILLILVQDSDTWKNFALEHFKARTASSGYVTEAVLEP